MAIPESAVKIVTAKYNTFFNGNTITIGTTAPTTGTYKAGDLVLSSSANSTAFGWICTTSGTPGTWKTLSSGDDVSTAWNDITGKPSTFTPKLGTTSTTAFRGDYGNTAYNHAISNHAPSNAQKNSDITKAEIEAKLTGDITTHNHDSRYYTETEVDDLLNGKADVSHNHSTANITSLTNFSKASSFSNLSTSDSLNVALGKLAKAADLANTAYKHATSTHAPTNAQKNSDITKAEIEAKLTGDITTHTHDSRYYTETEVDNFISDIEGEILDLTTKLPVTFYKDSNGDLYYV